LAELRTKLESRLHMGESPRSDVEAFMAENGLVDRYTERKLKNHWDMQTILRYPVDKDFFITTRLFVEFHFRDPLRPPNYKDKEPWSTRLFEQDERKWIVTRFTVWEGPDRSGTGRVMRLY